VYGLYWPIGKDAFAPLEKRPGAGGPVSTPIREKAERKLTPAIFGYFALQRRSFGLKPSPRPTCQQPVSAFSQKHLKNQGIVLLGRALLRS